MDRPLREEERVPELLRSSPNNHKNVNTDTRGSVRSFMRPLVIHCSSFFYSLNIELSWSGKYIELCLHDRLSIATDVGESIRATDS